MKARLSILIIEDDKYSRLNLREILQPFGVIEEATNVPEAREKLKSYAYDIVITDLLPAVAREPRTIARV